MRPHRQQPTRLPCPWDSLGKNTEVGCHFLLQCMKVKSESEVAQSCPTLSDPMDCSLPGSSVHGSLQARVLEWGAIAFSLLLAMYYYFIQIMRIRVKYTFVNKPLLLLLSRFSCIRLCATPQMAAHRASLSLGFSRQEHWSGLPFPSPMHES